MPSLIMDSLASPNTLDVCRVLDNIPQPVWSAFPDGTLEFVNRRWREFTGLTEEQTKGQGWKAAFHPHDLERLITASRKAGAPVEAEVRMKDKDGEYRWFVNRVQPMLDEQGQIIRWYGTNTYINDRKQMEDRLRRVEERFLLAAQAGRMFAYEWDAATDQIERSGDSAQILGIDEKALLTGQEALAGAFAEDQEKVASAVAALSPQNPNLYISHRIILPDGSLVWLERTSKAEFDESGKILRVVGMVADITQRKQAEEALHKRDIELEESQRLATVGSWHWDLTSDTITWSEELYRIAGMDPKQPAISFEEHFHLFKPESWERLRRAVETTLQNGTPFELEVEVVRPDGTQGWTLAKGEALRDSKGQVVALRGTVLDFTERWKIQEALRESEKRFRLLANSAPVLIWMSGAVGQYTYFNQPWLDFTGRYFEEELDEGWQMSIHPEDLRRRVEAQEQAFREKRGFRIEYRLLRFDGEYRWILDSGVPRWAPDGSLAGHIGSAIDVTDRKRAEESLAKLGGQLIEAQEKERRRIARELHDDVCQRLSLLCAELEEQLQLSGDSQSPNKRKAEEMLEKVVGLTNDVNMLSHRLHPSQLEYLGVVPAMNSFCEEIASHHHVEIDFTSSGLPDSVSPELSLCLFRVLQEGLTNAVKHSGIRHFEAHLQGKSDELELRITDAGLGFDIESGKHSGGLGLISMKERVGLVNGTISINSKPMQGTEILVRVPIRHSAPANKIGKSA